MRQTILLLPGVLPLLFLKATPGTDITNAQGITIGGTFAPWGSLVTVPDSLAYATGRGKCAYRISYGVRNLGPIATPVVFKNTITAGPELVNTKDSLLLNGFETRQVPAQIWLAPGTFDLILRLDASNTVSESNETNNVVRVRLTLDGTCRGKKEAVGLPAIPGDEKAHVPLVPPGTPNTGAAGSSAGLTPGYQTPDTRSGDAEIIINYRQALAQRLGGAASSIIVQFSDRVLTLTGRVSSQAMKRAAEDAASGVRGITKVNNLLVVNGR